MLPKYVTRWCMWVTEFYSYDTLALANYILDFAVYIDISYL